MSTSPPMNTEASEHNDPRQTEHPSSSSNLPENQCTTILFKGFDEPLDIRYPRDDNNPIDVNENVDFSSLGKRPRSSTFSTRRSSRVFEKTVQEGPKATTENQYPESESKNTKRALGISSQKSGSPVLPECVDNILEPTNDVEEEHLKSVLVKPQILGIKAFRDLMRGIRQKMDSVKNYYRLHGNPLGMQIWLYQCCSLIDNTITFRSNSEYIPRMLNWMRIKSQPTIEYLMDDMFKEGDDPIIFLLAQAMPTLPVSFSKVASKGTCSSVMTTPLPIDFVAQLSADILVDLQSEAIIDSVTQEVLSEAEQQPYDTLEVDTQAFIEIPSVVVAEPLLDAEKGFPE
ncbi:hypothetical protein RND71_034243 [Anisodus tanguticus]|uniref:Uncharacterized protein n=1 Tax=Anisodus tanguticus TaxID=243964 RepID=A0AAE1V403_9SOLA|nr:hypothetical protein RND71_034243 [Anisodus tanguticus]